MGPRAAIAELGLTGSAVRGIGIALLSSLPMLVVLLLISKSAIRVIPRTMFSAVVIAAATEEILFRGYPYQPKPAMIPGRQL